MNEKAAALVVERYRVMSFEWGAVDCVHFVCDFLDARLGTDYLRCVEAAIPRYSTPLQAIRILTEMAGGPTGNPIDPWELAISKFLGPPIPVLEAQFGDVVLARGDPPMERCVALGICDEDKVMTLGEVGLVFFDLRRNGLRAWKCRKP
jgi:hypothetical protein